MKSTLLLILSALFLLGCEKETESLLLQVRLPDGSILYVHPTDNSRWMVWGDHIDIPEIDNIISHDSLYMDFNGAANTLAIVNTIGNFKWCSQDNIICKETYAAKLCADLIAFGFDDWYLPATGELNIMYRQLGPTNNGYDGSGEITYGEYWSSSEFSSNTAWKQHFDSFSYQYESPKLNGDRCRCVRR
jgi:hypothetical protein